MKRYSPLLLSFFAVQSAYALPKGFVYLNQVAPQVIEELRYGTKENFMGRPVPGYLANRCILTLPAAQQLAKAEKAALAMGYTFKVYDCYRPQKAVNAFYTWSQDSGDQKMKSSYYPREDKETLFDKGYIAKASGHSRGSTVDLTLVKLGAKSSSSGTPTACYGKDYNNDNSLNTGTRFDCFDVSAHVDYQNLTSTQKTNRHLLQSLMLRFGFKPYKEEWWHFTLKNEPYPKTYFNFAVK
ncbi:M15 family metallopeptidase [Legionella hackeliae]|uniref:D-alanyl-D-alanine dipeptidase n=2 Tax=Legionella hackeliae TaxID=449 RepID=A0A0A8UWE4_LEGHA|nr:M15 family metallopeptidase [Legionella hackeliae]CEK11871.1 D-alanyl-D-alanine dipeptidase [Legionella hackeliae]